MAEEQQTHERKAGGDPAEGVQGNLEEQREEAQQEIEEMRENPPEKLEDWPDGKAKYETLGGPEHDTSYDEAAGNLGPADVRHYEDGSVTVGGEKVDNPEDYKGDPIPGGPTDPDAEKLAGEKDLTEESSQSGKDQE
jgi:hypothetical protein